MSQEHTSRWQDVRDTWAAWAGASAIRLRLAVFCGLLLFTFAESLLISQSTGSGVHVFSLSIPGMSVFMLALACGILLGGTLDGMQRKCTPGASGHLAVYQCLPGLFACGAAALLLVSPHVHEGADSARAVAAVFAGVQVPRLLTLLTACAPMRVQVIMFACAHALAEVLALTASLQSADVEHSSLYNSDLLPGLTIALLGLLHLAARRLPDAAPAEARCERPENQYTWVLATLMTAALLFFLLHATHDYAFRMYAAVNLGPPLWIRMGVRLLFPMLALIVSAWGLMPLAAVSVAMSALAPALEIFPGNTASYWGVFAVDTAGLHGGLFFFILAFGRVARQYSFAGLLRSLPFLAMYVTFGGMGIFNDNTEEEPLNMLVASLVILGVQVALMVCMQSRWNAMLRLNEPASAPPEEPAQTMETLSGSPSDAAVDAFALAHCISPRETQVLHLICEGLSYAQIAGRLFIAENTIKIHVSRILKKTASKSRSQLVCKIFDPQRQGIEGNTE